MANINLRLGFLTDEDETFGVVIKDPKLDLTDAQVATAMDALISSNAFSVTKGNLTSRKYARLVTDNARDVNIA